MNQFEHKEGILFIGGQVAKESTRAAIAALSACTGKDIKTTCDLLNQLLQSFGMLVDGLQDALQTLWEAFTEASGICEPCRRRGTQHGSAIEPTTPMQAKANIKWWEKYRPP